MKNKLPYIVASIFIIILLYFAFRNFKTQYENSQNGDIGEIQFQLKVDDENTLAIAQKGSARQLYLLDQDGNMQYKISNDDQYVLAVTQSEKQDLVVFSATDINEISPDSALISLYAADYIGEINREIAKGIDIQIKFTISPDSSKVGVTTTSYLGVIDLNNLDKGIEVVQEYKAKKNPNTSEFLIPESFWDGDEVGL